MSHPVIIRRRGHVSYADAYAEMRAFTETRTAASTDEIWLLEHPPVYTLGTNADENHVLNAGDTPLVKTDRGGQVTWHGPGQLMVYVLLDLQRANIGIRDMVCRLEQAVIAMLAEHAIVAQGRSGAPGVYAGDAKIASIGLRVRRHCSYHGLAINVCNDLQAFGGINPCGYEGLAVTRCSDLNGPADLDTAGDSLLPHLLKNLNLHPNAPT
jgi:lipoyl(octanoyl) transferase